MDPTIVDVAREAGVSRATASYVLAESKLARISSGTTKRVFTAARELGYKRNVAAATLRRGYSNTIVVLVVMWDVAWAHWLMTATVSRCAMKENLTTIVHLAVDDEEAAEFLRGVTSLKPYGLMLLWDSDIVITGFLEDLKSRGVPIVDLMPGPEEIVHITADREQAFRLCGQHVIDLGHRQIGLLLARARVRTSNDKLAGYKSALQSADVAFDEDLVEYVDGVGIGDGYEAMKRLISRRPDVTAVVCSSDFAALGSIFAAQDMGLQVPGHISVAGYGSLEEGAYLRPRLTTVSIPSAQIAEKATKSLVQIRTGADCTPVSFSAPVELIVRESTGPREELTTGGSGKRSSMLRNVTSAGAECPIRGRV